MLVKGKLSLLLVRHPPCYSYLQSSSVKVLTVIEEITRIRTSFYEVIIKSPFTEKTKNEITMI
jgi:hypothetical protein